MNLLKLIDRYNRTRPENAPWLNQARLARLADVSASMVTLHIQGKRPISDDHAARYARVLGVSIDEVRDDRAA